MKHKNQNIIETYLKKIFVSNLCAIFIIDTNKKIKYWSPKAEEITQIMSKDIIGKKCTLLCKNSTNNCLLFENNNPEIINNDLICTIYNVYDQPIYIKRNIDLIKNKSNNILGAAISFIDITEQIQIQEYLIQNQNFQNIIFSSVKDAIIIINNQGEIVFWNQAATNIYQYKNNEVIGRKIYDLIVPEEYKEAMKQWIKLFNKTGKAKLNNQTIELPAIKKNNEYFTSEISMSTFYYKHQWHAIGIVRDISERKNNEEKLIKNEKLFKTLFDSINDCAFLSIINDNKLGNFVQVNETACKELEYTYQELLSKTAFDIKPPEEHLKCKNIFNSLLKNKKEIFETFNVSKSGKKIPVEINAHLFEFNDQKLVLSIARNITNRKQNEQFILKKIVETQENERERFSKDLHDSINPLLSSLQLYVEVIKTKEKNVEIISLLNKTLEIAEIAINEIRNVANNLTPTLLKDFGIFVTLERFCKNLEESGTIKIFRHFLNYSTRFSETIEINIYRIITELINNTLRHSKANEITIIFKTEYNFLSIQYKDNGTNNNFIEHILVNNHAKSGISNIISRLKAIHGEIYFEKLNTGFVININIDLSKKL